MKKNKTLAILAIALATAFAAPFATRAIAGDIVDIRVVDGIKDKWFNADRNPTAVSAGTICSPDNPLSSGDELYIRVRMLVRNWAEVKGSMGVIAPKTWYFADGAMPGSAYPVGLGLWIGNHVAYAEYMPNVPGTWRTSGMLVTDDDGSANEEWKYYTDFYFMYKVQPGDLGLPVKLSNSTGTGPATSSDISIGYCLNNCGKIYSTSHYMLQNADGTLADFSYMTGALEADWPTSSIIWSGGRPDQAVQTTDLAEEGAYVKTIDFDGDYVESGVWRDVYLGMSAASATMPRLVVRGGAAVTNQVMYIWSEDESVVVPVEFGDGRDEIITVDGKKVLRVVVSEDDKEIPFLLRGADDAAIGATATIRLSPVQSAVYKPTGELDDVTVSRTVRVAKAPIDFDNVNATGGVYVDGDVWRNVYPGNPKAPSTTPTLLFGGNSSVADTFVYIWFADESVAVPVASSSGEVVTIGGKKVLKLSVSAGAERAEFSMMGAATASPGDTTTVYMSPMASAVSKTPAELATIAVSRTVEVIAAPSPEIHIALRLPDETTEKEFQTVTANSDYRTKKAILVFSTVTKPSVDVTLDLTATVEGGSSLTALYNGYILRICDPSATSILDGTPLQITFPAGQSTVEKDIYILGATEATESGILIKHNMAAGSPSDVTAVGSCTLHVNRGGAENPIEVTGASPAKGSTVTVESGASKPFTLTIKDTYKSLHDTATGYTFYLTDVDTGEELQTKSGVKATNFSSDGKGKISWSISFDKSYNGKTVVLSAISPDGATWTEEVQYTIRVSDSKQVLVDPVDAGVYTIGEGDAYAMILSLNQAFSGTYAKYIFLEGATDADKALFSSAQTTTGAAVGPNAPYTAPSSATFLDGGAGGTAVNINAFLSDSQTDPTDRTAGWSPGSISVTVTNKPPRIGIISIGGAPVMIEKGGTLPDPVSSGVSKTFSLTASDVDADLNATGDDAFQVRWSIDGQEYITKGNPNGAIVTNVFQTAKDKAPVFVYMKDKDMDWRSEPDFYFYVNVKDKPSVLIETMPGNGVFYESNTKGVDAAEVTVRLSEAATAPVVVRFTVSDVADGGFLRLRTTAGSVTNVYKEVGGEMVLDPNAYDIIFNAGAVERKIKVADMDGTDGTAAGMDLDAKVISEEKNADGVKWCDFYTPAESVLVVVENEAPEPIRPSLEETAYTNMNASANTPYAITYACKDVSADMASNIVVGISVDGTPVFTTNVNSTAAYTYSVEFSGEGAHFVEITYTDKDQMSSHRTLNFYVQPSKNLQLRAHGPAPAMATSGGYSIHYSVAQGLGAGRVFAGDAGPQKVWNFVHTYSFGITASAADAYAYGYKADDKFDDGNLKPSPDKGIDEYGDWQKGQVFGDGEGESKYYNYTRQHPWGRRGYDSFLYAWACNNSASSSTTGGDSQTSASLIVSPSSGSSLAIPLPEADDNAKALPMQYWEAVFSREHLKSDNCGDINDDGIPDVVALLYGMDIYDANGAVVKTDGEGDLTKLDSYNDDKTKKGELSPDYIPSTATSAYGSLIPGLAGTWVTLGREFTAKLEVRGYHEGLNDAMSQLGFDVVSDLVYAVPEETTDPDTGAVTVTWKWDEEKCTISELEYYAWTEYAAAHDWSPGAWTNVDGSVRWSPERPTTPVLNDFDDDGFDDGYEYYFWYRAHVGYMDGSVHKRMTGRRYDARNPGDGILITSEEIEAIFDPRVAYEPSGAATRDTDNDGLPDLLEFEIGTNPFDFDTDGDGLPDGWELMIAGLNPLLTQSSSEAVPDAERNYDGDAMAITSYQLEKGMDAPKQLHPEEVMYNTFAVIDPNGDSDGVQWYAATGTVEIATNTIQMYAFKLADGTAIVSSTEPKATAEGLLANTLARGVAFLATSREVVDDSVDPPVTNNVYTRGWPMYVAAGTPVDVGSIGGAQVDVDVLSVANAVKAENINAAWVYGKGSADNARGSVAKTAAEYGCLALGRQLALAKGAEFCAMPSTDRDVALLHYLVYQQCGFDPRTAWSTEDPLAARWGKVANGDTVEGVLIVGAGAYCSVPARTRAYTAYDEFLVYSFFLNNGCDMGGYSITIADSAPYLAKVWFAMTTNPQGPNEPGNITLNITTTDGSDAAAQYYFGRESENGADTDGDGVPDGWELYVMSGPKTKKGAFVFAPPYTGFHPALAADEVDMPQSYFSPFVPSAQKNDTNNQIYLGGTGNDDGFNEYQEFESTDAMNYYAKVYEGAQTATIVHNEEWVWLNKFFPTNPWLVDTDGDGLSDSAEKDNFAYTCPDTDGPVDGGTLRSIPGGGLNPNSVDTDCDGLPDPWEVQFKGSKPFPGDLPAALAALGDKSKNADGEAEGNYLQGLVNGMDGTVKDAFSYPIRAAGGTNGVQVVTADGFRQCVNRDYDHDGLENWQEYQTGMMRCWRYDDPISPWRPISYEAYYEGLVFKPNAALLEELTGDTFSNIDEFWYKTLVDKTSPLYNPRMVMDASSGAQYLSRVTNAWDSCYKDLASAGSSGAYYWFYNKLGDAKLEDVWQTRLQTPDGMAKAPHKYACCSPKDPDSDHDGMDDYYELFHGMNPLLGQSGLNLDSQNPCDLVYDSWVSGTSPAAEAWGTDLTIKNYWQKNPWKYPPRGNGYDFEVFPWLVGIVDADPDGDGIPNQTEALFPKLNTPELHSDPTPLWLTDASCTNSLVYRFFRMPTRYGDVYLTGDSFTNGVKKYEFKDFEGYVPPSDFFPAHFTKFVPDSWKLASSRTMNWMYSFEQNEGYDSDHDGLSDISEKEGKYRKATDVQDADSPRRRQAMYFQGPDRPSALQTMPQVIEEYPVQAVGYPDDMALRTFTVECWVRPESLDDSVIVERAVFISVENPADEEYMRKNFQLGIRDGRWYAKFDPFTTRFDDEVVAMSVTDADDTKWTHLAATYDGTDLVLYVNGVSERVVRSGLLPSYGSFAVTVHPAASGALSQEYWADSEYALHAFIVGASAKTMADDPGVDGKALDLTEGIGWNGYTRFYKGWIDEIRVWDGARTAAEIAAAKDIRFTAEMAAENQAEFFELWNQGQRRDAKDENGKPYEMPAELLHHWTFDSVFGAENEVAVATSPHGFNDERAVTSRAEGYEVPWWTKMLGAYDGTVYNDRAWVPWIPDTVAHLPRFDETTLDSFFWSEDFMGDTVGTYKFARSAEPASLWTQMSRNGTNTDSDYGYTGTRHSLVNTTAAIAGLNYLVNRFEFTGRHLNLSGDDLLPLGGAYAKFCDNDVGLWDGQGASSNWEVSGSDADGDGLPDWWEQYADENYRRAGMDPSEVIGWNTIVSYNGVEMIAGEAYLRDLARGAYLNEAGEIAIGETTFEQLADEDYSGIPDWWEEMYGITGESGLDDHDNDGLPNYVEYLLSEVFKFQGVPFSPINPHSADQYTLDYFYRVGSLYVGEIFTDYDQVDDVWEDEFSTLVDKVTPYASRFAYDAAADVDMDGWSNRSECRSAYWRGYMYSDIIDTWGVNEDYHFLCYPMPTVAIRPIYNGGLWRVSGKPVIVYVKRDGTKQYDAKFIVEAGKVENAVSTETGAGRSKVIGITHNGPSIIHGHLDPGHILPGDNVKFEMPPFDTKTYYKWHCTRCPAGGTTLYEPYNLHRLYHGDASKNADSLGVVKDGEFSEPADPFAQSVSGPDGRTGTIVTTQIEGGGASGVEVGSVNYFTGEFELDLGKVEKAGFNLYGKFLRVSWIYRIGTEWPQVFYLSLPKQGLVKEGPNTIGAFIDVNEDGKYDPESEPFGMVQGVDISWAGNILPVEIELTDASPVTPRFDVAAAGTMQVSTTNIATEAEQQSSGGGEETESLQKTQIRVVRWKIDDMPIYDVAVTGRVVFAKMVDPAISSIITEADLLSANTFDLDWEFFNSEVVNARGVTGGHLKVMKADYLVIVGDGDVVSWLNRGDTNRWATASTQVITRYYGENRVLPVPVSPGSISPATDATGIVNTANPTFSWTIDCPEREAYTAFRISVTGPGGKVYDSGIRSAPARDEYGVYRWSAPLYVDDKTTLGKVFANKEKYSWSVAMYNSKFKDDEFSATAKFYLEVQTDGYSTGTAKVGVRYFGPEKSYDGKVVRVQAFITPDFKGNPVAAGYVRDPSTLAKAGEKVSDNALVVGLPAGKYFLKAFIDSNNNGVCDDWESSGYLSARDGSTEHWLDPKQITVGDDVGYSEIAEIYIEDADTDYDGLPDSWEYALYRNLTSKGIELLSETPAGEELINASLVDSLVLRENAQVPAAGLATRVRSSLRNAGTLALALGVNPAGYDSFAAAISGSVSEKLAEDGVKITSLSFVDGKVSITVDVETETGSDLTGPLAASVAPKSSGIEVVAKVYWKQSLTDSQWTLVAEKTFSVGSGEAEIDAGDAVSGTSGFYKVVVEEK